MPNVILGVFCQSSSSLLGPDPLETVAKTLQTEQEADVWLVRMHGWKASSGKLLARSEAILLPFLCFLLSGGQRRQEIVPGRAVRKVDESDVELSGPYLAGVNLRPETGSACLPLLLGISVLDLRIAVVDEEQTGGIETPASEWPNERCQMAQFLKNGRNVVDEELVAIVQEGCESRGELLGCDLATIVLVLEDVALFAGLVDLK